jgi:FkbM family methyltransferase
MKQLPLTSTKPPTHVREIGPVMKLASFLSRHAPRAKGAIPRFMGRTMIKPETVYFLTRHGAHLVVDPNSFDVFVSMHAAGNAWDYHDFMICRDLMPDNGTFYDIGANVGYFSIEMLALHNGSVSVVSFEPSTGLAKALRLSGDICEFPNLTVFDAMVGDRSGDAEFYLAPRSIHCSAVRDSGRPVIGSIRKSMVAIDDLVEANEIPPPDVVKADIEGSEHLMLAGAARTFARFAPHIFMEYEANGDTELRIRHQVEVLMRTVPSYAIFGVPRTHLKPQFPNKLFEIQDPSHWDMVDSIVLRNRDKVVHDESMFGTPSHV